MWRDAALVAAKDLRIEARTRVATNQVLPVGVIVLVLFAFALDVEGDLLDRASAGLFWVAVLLSCVLAVQRSSSLESAGGTRDALRLSGLDPAGVFLGKAAALAVQLFAVEAVLAAGVGLLYGVEPAGATTLVATATVATAGLAGAGTLYGALAGGLRIRETLLPLLLLPAVAPVVIAATRATESALRGGAVDVTAADWIGLLAVFAVVYVAIGVVAFGTLLEDG